MSAGSALKPKTFPGSKIVVRMILTVLALGGVALGALKIVTSGTAKAANVLEYTVDPTNAATGVYARYGPHTSDTNRVNGYGVYPNETVALLCGVIDGDPVGQYANTTWHFVTDLSNTGEGNFWIADHYLDTPNVASQLTPGESLCANPIGSTAPPPQPSPVITAIFFSPNNTPSGTTNVNFNDPTLKEVPFNQWADGNCSDTKVGQNVPPTVSTLVGWSKGRLAPIYFLVANSGRWGQIHTIVLFDPGDTGDFTGTGTCDSNYHINSLLASWLQSNAENQLLVFTGVASEPNNFHGLWKFYFAGIWNQPFAHQAIVCDYKGMQHPDVLRNFAGYVGDLLLEPMTICPPSPDNARYPRTQWNP